MAKVPILEMGFMILIVEKKKKKERKKKWVGVTNNKMKLRSEFGHSSAGHQKYMLRSVALGENNENSNK